VVAQQRLPAPGALSAVVDAGSSAAASIPSRGLVEVAALRQPAPAATATVSTMAPVNRASSISCLCCYPPCLTEALATEVHLHVSGLDQLVVQGASAGTLDTYRVVAFHGSTAVAEVRGLIPGTDGLLRWV
jgi:hypothetical protein